MGNNTNGLKLRKGWKALILGIFIITVFGGLGIYAAAASSVVLQLTNATFTVEQDERNGNLNAILSGTDENAIDGVPKENQVEWKLSKSGVVDFCIGVGDAQSYSDTFSGLYPVFRGKSAGKIGVTASYYTQKLDENNEIIAGTKEQLASRSAEIVVPLKVSLSYIDSNGNKIPYTSGVVIPVGTILYVDTNASASNKMVLESDNDKSGNLSKDSVVKMIDSTVSAASIEIIGGGKTSIKVRTSDNTNNNSQLQYKFDIIAEVEFKENITNSQGNVIKRVPSEQLPTNGVAKYMILDTTDFVEFKEEEMVTNIIDAELANVDYTSDNVMVCEFVDGILKPKYAGIAKVGIGVYKEKKKTDTTPFTSDYVNVVVPFKKIGNDTTNLNVGDVLTLSTTARPETVSWTTSNNKILDVDENGKVTAKGSGTAIIYAKTMIDNYENIYKLPEKLEYKITVIDGFALDTTYSTVSVGGSFDLKALVTSNDIEKNPITYYVENQPGVNGVVPAGDVIKVEQDGRNFHITGQTAGIAKITATQNVNGVNKSDSCIIVVTTPVAGIEINPSSVKIDRGDKAIVQLKFTPSAPTNNNVLWGTSDSSIATVEGDSYTATIRGIKGGSTTINVVSQDGLKVANCNVYVREPVTGVALNATSVDADLKDKKYQLVPTVYPSGDGVDTSVIWSSSDEKIVKVDEKGLVTYVSPGYATVVCKTVDGAYIATCNFFVNIPVSMIKLDCKDEIMSVGQKLRITAEVTPLDATNKYLIWESSDTNVCMVDSNGFVEAVGTGSCTILCKSLDGGYTAMCNIYVKQPVLQVVLNTTDMTVRKGQVFWLNATCLPENADNKIVEWTSRDDTVCKVEKDGKITAVGPGTTSVIATNTDTGITAYCVITVIQPISSISLNSNYQLMWVGSKYAIIPTIEPYDAPNKKVTYTSSDKNVATVDENGVVTAVKGGTCIIEVITDECNLIAACTIDVKEYVSSITLGEKNKYMNVNATGTLSATVETSTATNKNIVWSSSNNDICRVDSKGNIIAVGIGTAVITATAQDGSGVTDSCIIRVVEPVKSITLSPDSVKLLIGQSYKLTANIVPSNASIKEVEWSSSNENVAIVDDSGEIFAVGAGKAKITAKSIDGNDIKAVSWVYVTPVVNISSLKLNSKDIYMLTGKQRQLNVIVRPVVNNDSYEWYSTDTGIVTVNDKGVITTVGPGTAEVFVESVANGVSSTCTVHSLAINRSSMKLEQNDSNWLDIIGIDSGDKVVWRSSNPRIATVTADGKVTGRLGGTTTITATTHEKTLTCTVTVYNMK